MKRQITVRLRDGDFEPVSAYDAEQLAGFKNFQEFECRPLSERSKPHSSLYWKILSEAVKATGKWATPHHLHTDLKLVCGYYKKYINGISGEIYYVADSINFKTMNQHDFNIFFDITIAKLAETLGYDPIDKLSK